MTGTDLVLVLVVALMPWVALAAVLAPLVFMGAERRWSVAGVALWLVAAALAARWVVATIVEMDRVDAAGSGGNASSEVGWLLGAVAAATASIVLAARRPCPLPPAAHSWPQRPAQEDGSTRGMVPPGTGP